MKRKRYLLIIIGIAFYLILLFLLVHFESYNEGASIQGIGHAVWYSLVTLSTVGYGDMFPLTVGGKIIAVIFLISSVSLLSFVVGNFYKVILNRQEKKKMGLYGTEFENHIVVVGWDKFTKSVIRNILNEDKKVALIVDPKNDLEAIYSIFENHRKNLFCLQTEYQNIELFSKVNIEKAEKVFVHLQNDTDNLVVILNMKKHFPNCDFIVILDNENLKETFQSAGVTFVISKDEIAAKLMASYLFEPDVADFNLDILSDAKNENDFDVQQYKVIEGNQFIGKTYKELMEFFLLRQQILPVGLTRQDGNERKLQKLPAYDTIIKKNDFVLFIVNGESKKEVAGLFKVEQGIN